MLHLDLASTRFEFYFTESLSSLRRDTIGVVVSYILVSFTLKRLRHYRVNDLTVNFSTRIRLLSDKLKRIVELVERGGCLHLFDHLTCFSISVLFSLRSKGLVHHVLRVEGQVVVQGIQEVSSHSSKLNLVDLVFFFTQARPNDEFSHSFSTSSIHKRSHASRD